jgi:hypothetical protein
LVESAMTMNRSAAPAMIFSRVRGAAALHQPAVRGDLVGTIDGDVETVEVR